MWVSSLVSDLWINYTLFLRPVVHLAICFCEVFFAVTYICFEQGGWVSCMYSRRPLDRKSLHSFSTWQLGVKHTGDWAALPQSLAVALLSSPPQLPPPPGFSLTPFPPACLSCVHPGLERPISLHPGPLGSWLRNPLKLVLAPCLPFYAGER